MYVLPIDVHSMILYMCIFFIILYRYSSPCWISLRWVKMRPALGCLGGRNRLQTLCVGYSSGLPQGKLTQMWKSQGVCRNIIYKCLIFHIYVGLPWGNLQLGSPSCTVKDVLKNTSADQEENSLGSEYHFPMGFPNGHLEFIKKHIYIYGQSTIFRQFLHHFQAVSDMFYPDHRCRGMNKTATSHVFG